MQREQCRLGMKVYFGRDRGEKTLGEIVKLNPSKAKVRCLVQRGQGRGSHVGAEWGVPYSMMEPANGEAAAPVQRPALKYSPFQPAAEQHILSAIACVYGDLSPENLTCDGELSTGQVIAKRAILQRQLKGLFMAFGREVDEIEVYAWERQRREQSKRD